MSNYWINRINKQNDINYRKSVKETDQQIIKLYKKTAKSIVGDISNLLDTLNKPVEEIKINDLYRNNRYYSLLNKINRYLRKLGEDEIKILDNKLLDMYDLTSSLVSNQLGFEIGFNDSAKRVVDSIWCPDGQHWSNRIWKNKTKMQEILEQGLTDCLARGLPKDKLVSEMARLTNTQRYQSERIVRTELTFIQNQACSDTYEKAGITKYKYITAHDERTSDICKKLDGKVFYFKDKKVGVNFPCMHPFVDALSFQ